MSGHSHWAGIKHKKEITDKKRGKEFSKLLAAITAAVHTEPNPDFNPRLRTAVEKARASSVPNDTIARAIARASEQSEALKDVVMEAYGPGGIAILIVAITDNSNRTVAEVKSILTKNNGKWAEPGSVQWAFTPPREPGGAWEAKFPQAISMEDNERLSALVTHIEGHDDVQVVYINASAQ